MGFFLDENGDPKAWAGCLLCGFAAMGSDELEEKRDKLKQAEREARWKAAKTPVRKYICILLSKRERERTTRREAIANKQNKPLH